MSDRFWSWTLALIVLIVACLINTVLLDEIVSLLDENIKAVARVSLEYNLGWKLAMSASAFALLGTALNWLVALMLMIQVCTYIVV